MFSEWYLNRRYAKGLARGRAEGRAKGRDEGRATERARWESWNRARVAAEEQGKKFIEPPPSAIDGHRPGERA